MAFLCFLLSNLHSQNPDLCVNYPETRHFDRSCFMHLGPEIQLGEGRIKGPYTYDLHFPNNRPGWALSVAHSYQLLRNITKQDILSINYMTALPVKESMYLCDDGATWDNNHENVRKLDASHNLNKGTYGAALIDRDGCFQLDRSTGWPVYELYYPNRFNNGTTDHINFVAGPHFETGAIIRTYYDLIFWRKLETSWGLDPADYFANDADTHGAEKVFAASWNKGHQVALNGIAEPIFGSDRANALANTDLTSYDNAYLYWKTVSHITRVLDNKATTADIAQGGAWHQWYDAQYSWNDVLDYMNTIMPLHPEVTNQAAVIANVKAVFDGINGGGDISFRYDMAPVLDEFILNLPFYDPQQVVINGNLSYLGCHSVEVPYVEITHQADSLTICKGLSIELTATSGTGFQYQWTKDGTAILGATTDKFKAKETGTYDVEVTFPNGETITANCPVTILVDENCSNCNLATSLTVVNEKCRNAFDGQLDVVASGETGPFVYEWTGPVTSTNSSINKATNGNYFVKVTKSSDPLCVAYADATVDFDFPVYHSLDLDTTYIDCQTYQLDAQLIDIPTETCDYTLEIAGAETWHYFPNTMSVQVKMDGKVIGNVGKGTHSFKIAHGGVLEINVLNTDQFGAGNVNDPIYATLSSSDGSELMKKLLKGVSYPANSSTNLYNDHVFCAQPQPNYTFTWSPTNGLSDVTILNPVATVSATTKYVITGVDPSNPQCPIKDSVVLPNTCNGNTCVAATQASVSSAGNVTAVCAGSTLQLTVTTDQTAYDTQWKLDGSPISGATSSTYTADQAGVYSVVITDPNDLTCSYESTNTEKFTLDVTALVDSEVEITSDLATVCAGDEVIFSIQAIQNAGSTQSYEWFVNGTSQHTGDEFKSSTLVSSDVVIVKMTTDQSCANSTTVSADPLSVMVNSSLIPAIEIESTVLPVCTGDLIDFTIKTQTNEGTSPSYIWFVNNANVGTGTSFSSSSLADGDQVKIELTSSETCVSSPTISSNEIAVQFTTGVLPSIQINSDQTVICQGTAVNFSIASQSNEGTSPSYEWFIGSTSVGTGTTYSSTNLVDGDKITCKLTSDASCVTTALVASNEIEITVSSSVSPTLLIKETSPIAICQGEQVTFEVDGGNGLGTSPIYDWYVNAVQKATNSNVFDYSGFADGDKVTAKATNLSSCANASDVNSNEITISIIQPQTPAVTIESNIATSCEGDAVDFSILSQNNEGVTPIYEWFKNGSVSLGVGTTLTVSDLISTDKVSLVLTVVETCVTSSSVTSNELDVVITPKQIPTIEIQSSVLPICSGESVDFSIKTQTNEGATPTYDWYVNNNLAASGLTYSSTTLVNNDVVFAKLNSSSTCLTSAIVSSNTIAVLVNANGTLPDLQLDAVKNPICQFDEVELQASSSVTNTFAWFVNGVVQAETSEVFLTSSINDGDVVKVELSSQSTCSSQTVFKELTIGVKQIEYADISPTAVEICSDQGPVTLTVTNLSATNLVWIVDGNEIENSNSKTYQASTSGYYGVRIHSDACGTFNYMGSTVTVIPTPTVTAGPDLGVNQGESVTFQSEISNGDIVWSPTTYLDDNEIEQPTASAPTTANEGTVVYKVTANDGLCTASDEMVLTIYKDLEVYNAFSPNGDGINDVWVIAGIEKFPKASIKVFNRWGAEVFSSANYETPWDGLYKGEELPSATYYYIIELNDPTAVRPALDGSVTILK